MRTLPRTTPKLVAVVAAAAFALAACGSDPEAGGDRQSSSSPSSSPHNDADVSFATSMVPHHAQAVEMTRMATARAGDPGVKALAADIEAAQGPEIELLSGWLEAWGEQVPATDGTGMDGMDGMDATGSAAMPGMMTSDQMSRLGKASGAEFDRMWLRLMIRHHEGAVTMARAEQRDGRDADAVALATRIEAAQTAEVSRMQEWLGV